MKNFLLTLFMILVGLSSSAEQIYELNKDCDYMFFSEDLVKSIKSNNPEIISAQRVMTYLGEGSQLIFSAKKTGNAKIQITTNKGIQEYSISIINKNAKNNSTFLELDFPMEIKP